MPEVEIRAFAPGDAPAAADLLSDIFAGAVVTTERVLHDFQAIGQHGGAWWTAEAGGTAVGFAAAERDLDASSDGVYFVQGGVRADLRRRGLGARLYRIAEDHALARGASLLRAIAMDDLPDAARFLGARGFELRRTMRQWALDPASVDLSELPGRERAAASAGYRVAPLRDLLGRPETLYRVFNAASADIPNDVEHDGLPYEHWRRHVLEDPCLDLDGSCLVLAGDEPVALAWLSVDRLHSRAGNRLTGTVRDHRHRGLARLAKLVTVRWAAANGIGRIVTANDSTNRDMLALNEHLGYQALAQLMIFAKAVSAPG